ncbi:MAG: DUF402 domain-containing protein [Anaerolineae bacterium]|nr:DUF402 domain-containing protein [Anaerolineae bacterium]
MQPIIIIKCDPQGQALWQYSGTLTEKKDGYIVVEARFNRPDVLFHGILLAEGDRFIETYFADRWFNIQEIHDKHTDALKGWYCNIAYPAEIAAGRISYRDLAIDLLVYPDGRQLVLDEDEFAALDVADEIRAQAEAALQELKERFHQQEY